jgi:uncharacterized protein with FMN-binding domain
VVTSPHVTRARRNTAVVGASAAALGLLFLYPTSTNSGGSHRRPGTAAAPVGIVAAPRTSAAPRANPTLVVNGASEDTAYGPVQVQLKVRAGRIVAATAIDYPQGSGTDQQINSYAIPLLQQETVQAQSVHIDTVSGATYTSDGYRQSLQAALDAAHLQ